jgi:hypothetical protein
VASALLMAVALGPCAPASGQTPGTTAGTEPVTSWVVDPQAGLVPALVPLTVPPLTAPPPTITSVLPRIVNLPGPPPGITPGPPFEFHPTAGLSQEYTDNFDRTATGRRDDFRTSASAGGLLRFTLPTARGFASYTLTGAYDTANQELSAFQSLDAQARWEATPLLMLTVTDGLTRSDQPQEADRLGLRQERRNFTSNLFSLTSDYRLGTIDTRQYYRLSTFVDEDAQRTTMSHTLGASAATTVAETNRVTLGYEYLNSHTTDAETIAGHRVTGSVARQLNALPSAGVSASYSLRTLTSSGSDEDVQEWTAALFGGYVLPERWSVTGNVGLSVLSGRGTRSIVSGSIGLLYRLARGTFGLLLERGFSETFAEGENFGIVETQGVTATLSYAVTPLVTCTGQVFYRQNEPTRFSGDSGGEKENVWGGTAAVAYQVRPWLVIGIDYGYSNADFSGTPAGGGRSRGDVIENRVRISLSAVF